MSFITQKNLWMFACLLIVCYYLINISQSDKYSLDNFPNPVTENGIKLCGRDRISFICDPDQFISFEQGPKKIL